MVASHEAFATDASFCLYLGDKQFYLKIYIAVLVHVESAEYVIAEFDSIPRREKHLVHVDKFCRCQSAVRAVLL